MRPIPHLPWGGDPHLRLADESDSFAYSPDFKFGPPREQEIRAELAYPLHDGREPWPTEMHRRLSRCLRMWLRTHDGHKLVDSLIASQPDRMPWRQLVEDLVIAANGEWRCE